MPPATSNVMQTILQVMLPLIFGLLVIGIWPSAGLAPSAGKGIIVAFFSSLGSLWIGILLILKSNEGKLLFTKISLAFALIALLPLVLSLRGGLTLPEWSGIVFEPDSLASFAIFALWGIAGTLGGRLYSTARIIDGCVLFLGILSLWQLCAGFFSFPQMYPLLGDAFSQALLIASLLIVLFSKLFFDRPSSQKQMWYFSTAGVAALSFVSAPFLAIGVSSALAILVIFFLGSKRVIFGTDSFEKRTPHRILLGLIFVVLCVISLWGTTISTFLGVRSPRGELRLAPAATALVIARAYVGEPVISIFGTGASSFTYVWNTYRPLVANTTSLWNVGGVSAFGLLPTLFVTLGAPFVFFLLLLLGMTWTFVLKELFKPSESHSLVALGMAAVFLLTWLTLYLPSSAYLAVAAFLAGLFVTKLDATVSSSAQSPTSLTRTLLILCGVAIVLVGVGGMWQSTLRGDALTLYQRAVRVTEEGGEIDTARDLLKASIATEALPLALRSLSFVNREEVSRLLEEASDVGAPALMNRIETLLDEGRIASGNAVAEDPADFNNALERASLMTIIALLARDATFQEQALGDYNFAISQAKLHPLPHFGKAQALILFGRGEEAREPLQEALRLKGDYEDALALQKTLEENVR